MTRFKKEPEAPPPSGFSSPEAFLAMISCHSKLEDKREERLVEFCGPLAMALIWEVGGGRIVEKHYPNCIIT